MNSRSDNSDNGRDAAAVAPDSEALVLSRLDDKGALTLTLNRPAQFNALSQAMLSAMQEALEQIDDHVRVVVIAANGRAFCAGHDLREMRSHADEAWQCALFQQCSQMMQTLVSLPQPVIARVQGVAAAAGCQLVASCDLAVAADHASFGVSGINLGLFCSTPSVALSRNLSRKRAFQLLMSGEFISAQTAVDWGLLNECVADELLDASIEQWCNTICSKSKVAVSTGKRLFHEQLERPLDQAYALASDAMACNMMAEDVAEGIDAFFDKRPPNWKHR
ncbi:enoyl-CoA hydratase [Granulosicoccus sp. 3-233]|uniref:enoyl-CoA hydratase n=1 Tax=Granulosicoccus sp. 3-233 TaxID=3417969 RepID=UPI003D339AFF